MYFRTYGLRMTRLDKCLKGPLSEDPLTSNMANDPRHCRNLDDTTFIIFVGHFE